MLKSELKTGGGGPSQPSIVSLMQPVRGLGDISLMKYGRNTARICIPLGGIYAENIKYIPRKTFRGDIETFRTKS